MTRVILYVILIYMANNRAIEKFDADEEVNSGISSGGVGDILLSWEYPEYIAYNRGLVWYILAIVVTIALLVYAFLTENNLFMIIIVLTVIIFAVANSRRPEKVQFAITNIGIVLNDKFIAYNDIKNFWIIYQPPAVKTLYIEPKSFFSPRIQIHIEEQNPSQIRDLLLPYLMEDLEKEDEPQSEIWGRLFKL